MGGHVNWASVFIGAIASFIFGAIYYTTLGKAWLAAQGKTADSCKVEMAGKSTVAKVTPFILSFVGALIMGVTLYGILTHSALWSLRAGVITGAFCWFGFVLTTVVVNNAYTGRKPMLSVIDCGHWLGALMLIGGIVGWMGPN
jgi:hypothetical protein